MKFRTQIELKKSTRPIRLSERIVSLGSCFSQAIGNRLVQGGISTHVTPLGILFNPISIAHIVGMALSGKQFTKEDLYCDRNNIFHALALESRRQKTDAEILLTELNRDMALFAETMKQADIWLITFGTAWCFRHIITDTVVGNCHKLPDSEFSRYLCRVEDILEVWQPILSQAPRTIFTVSPVRHLNDGLHGNTLSKARLHLAVEQLCESASNAEYFPAFEALNDDLRDYRFYADDLKHPSTFAEDYIFELFLNNYFTTAHIREIEQNRRDFRHSLHRPILG